MRMKLLRNLALALIIASGVMQFNGQAHALYLTYQGTDYLVFVGLGLTQSPLESFFPNNQVRIDSRTTIDVLANPAFMVGSSFTIPVLINALGSKEPLHMAAGPDGLIYTPQPSGYPLTQEIDSIRRSDPITGQFEDFMIPELGVGIWDITFWKNRFLITTMRGEFAEIDSVDGIFFNGDDRLAVIDVSVPFFDPVIVDITVDLNGVIHMVDANNRIGDGAAVYRFMLSDSPPSNVPVPGSLALTSLGILIIGLNGHKRSKGLGGKARRPTCFRHHAWPITTINGRDWSSTATTDGAQHLGM